MRYLEAFLKLEFLVGSIYLIATQDISSFVFICFLMLCNALGIMLIFNKDASYHFKQTKRDLMLRQIEGVILLVFPALIYVMK